MVLAVFIFVKDKANRFKDGHTWGMKERGEKKDDRF